MAGKVRIGVIGAGRIGRLHTENILHSIAQAEVVSLCDPYVELSDSWARDLSIKQLTNDPEEIFRDSEIDAVLICSPTDTHAAYSIAAARAGKHVFCEKPIDFSVVRIQEVLREVKASRVTFQVGFNRRFDVHFRTLRERILEDDIGDLQILKITSRDPSPPPLSYIRSSGGMFLDMTIHDFDMARYLTGSEVRTVFTRGAALIDMEIGAAGDVDTAVTLLQMDSGALVVVDNSRQAVYGYDQRIEAFGSKGQLAADNVFPTNLVHSGTAGIVGDKPMNFFLERYNDSFIAELRSFVQSVSAGCDAAVTGTDGYAAVLVGLAAKESAQTGRLVEVPAVMEE